MLAKLTEIYPTPMQTGSEFGLREVYVNPKHVVSLREDFRLRSKLEEGVLPAELKTEHVFTKMTLDKGTTGLEIIVIGRPSTVESKLRTSSRELLNG